MSYLGEVPLRQAQDKLRRRGYFGSLSFQLIRLSSLAQPEPAFESTPILLMISYLISDMVQISSNRSAGYEVFPCAIGKQSASKNPPENLIQEERFWLTLRSKVEVYFHGIPYLINVHHIIFMND